MEDWRRRYPCPIWHLDFLTSADVMMMTHSQIGIYTLLLFWQWDATGCVLPNNEEYLESITKVRTEEERVALGEVLRKCFRRTTDAVFNRVMLHQFEEKKAHHESAVMSGRLGGRPSKRVPIGSPKQSESKTKASPPPSPSPPKNRYPSDFELFWSVYPRRVGKAAALRAWEQLKNERPDVSVLIAKVREVQSAGGFAETRFVPHPSTWLRGQRWEDDAVAVAGPLAAKAPTLITGVDGKTTAERLAEEQGW